MSSCELQVSPEDIKEAVSRTTDVLASFITVVHEIEYKVKKNNYASITEFETTTDLLKQAIQNYIECYQNNLASLTTGVVTIEELDGQIANAINKLEMNNNRPNNTSLGWSK